MNKTPDFILRRLSLNDAKERAVDLLRRHNFTHTLDEMAACTTQMVEALEGLTPWMGDDCYADIAYLHDLAFLHAYQRLREVEMLSRLHDALVSSIEDWMDLASNSERSTLCDCLVLLNGALLGKWRFGSRAVFGTLLLLRPDATLLVRALAEWPPGRFGRDDILLACEQAKGMSWDPIDILCSDTSMIKLIDQDNRPDWYTMEADGPPFTEAMGLDPGEIHRRLDEGERRRLLDAIRRVS